MRYLLFAVALLVPACTRPADRVVVYSAQDEDYATPVLNDLGSKLGLSVAPKFDTEATKSVGLVTELLEEVRRPRCDVHWNNEPLGTIRLFRKGVYAPYVSPEDDNYLPTTIPTRGTIHPFAERVRVLLVNTRLVPEGERPRGLLELTAATWKGRVAMAKPQFGTTATQAACLFEAIGPEAAKAFYLGLKANGVQIVAGNKAVALAVSRGDAAVGLTDSDDAMLEALAGKEVVIVVPDREPSAQHPRLGALYLPNTLAVVNGGPNPEGAQKLIDLLLSQDAERKLAEGGGYQLPLRRDLAEVRRGVLKAPTEGRRMLVDWGKAADQWDESQTFLRDTFAR